MNPSTCTNWFAFICNSLEPQEIMDCCGLAMTGEGISRQGICRSDFGRDSPLRLKVLFVAKVAPIGQP